MVGKGGDAIVDPVKGFDQVRVEFWVQGRDGWVGGREGEDLGEDFGAEVSGGKRKVLANGASSGEEKRSGAVVEKRARKGARLCSLALHHPTHL